MATKKLQILNSIIKQAENADTLDGKHASEFAEYGHIHSYNDLEDKPTSLPADGGNADTLDGKHASEFAAASLVGDTPVVDQITQALGTFEFITTDDIDTICGTTIQMASSSEVTF